MWRLEMQTTYTYKLAPTIIDIFAPKMDTIAGASQLAKANTM